MDDNNSEQRAALGIIWAIVGIVVICILGLAAYFGINGAPKGTDRADVANSMASAVLSTANAATATTDTTANAVGANGANGADASATATTNGTGNATAVAIGADGASGAPARVVGVTIEVVRIFFAEGKSAVPTAAATDLSSIATYMKEHPEAKASISGFNDASGNAEVNAEVSKNRAKAVRDTLTTAGVATDRIELEKPQATTAGDTAAARRVEVTVHN